MKIGVSLTGGGARGSYQAGVLLGLSELLKHNHLVGKNNPLYYWSGASAGSINQAYCLAGADDLPSSCHRLADIWSNLKTERIYRTDFATVSRNSVKWLRDLTLGPILKSKSAKSLLNTEPLAQLLTEGIYYGEIQKKIDDGFIFGAATTAFNYTNGKTVTFVQAKEKVIWDKPKRYSVNVPLDANQIMASCAIPVLFPPVKVGDDFYADGGFRCTTPISPVIHMGAKKILMIGVRGPSEVMPFTEQDQVLEPPGIARVAGHILNALFFDNIDLDLERIQHLNELVDAVRASGNQQGDVKTKRSDYSKIDVKFIRPSRDISRMANESGRSNLPMSVDYLLQGLGSKNETGELASYILFDKAFTRDLVDLGYKDFQNQSDQISKWLMESNT